MPSDRHRLLELALESLEIRKKQLDSEIAELSRELRGLPPVKVTASAAAAETGATPRARRQSRFSKEERERRSERMRAYWDNWRKKKSKTK